MSAADFHLVFDLSQKGFEWWFPGFGLIFVAVGAVIALIGRHNRWPLSRRMVGYFMIAFACLWSGLAFSSTYADYRGLKSAYRSGQFSIIEGNVSNFRPMPYGGHSEECFSVQSKTFCYSDYVVTSGFNNTASHGGPIRDGLPVRVSYIGNTIVRLEVRADAILSPGERATTAEAAKKEWRQQQAHDPFLNRMNFAKRAPGTCYRSPDAAMSARRHLSRR